MIEKIYNLKWKQDQIKSGPLFPCYAPFIKRKFKQGYNEKFLSRRLRIVNFLNKYMEEKDLALKKLNQNHIDDFLKLRIKTSSEYYQRDLNTLAEFISFIAAEGFIAKQDRRRKYKLSEIDLLLNEYGEHMQDVRGRGQDCVRRHIQHSRNFLRFANPKGGLSLENIDIKIIHKYILRQSRAQSTSYSRYEVSALRAFLKFLFVTNRVKADYSMSLFSVANWKETRIPKIFTKEELKKIINGIDRQTTMGNRTYLMILLLMRYGLRAKEVRVLKLEDIDWASAIIKIHHSKTGKVSKFPLYQDVGLAIQDYIKNYRPKSSCPYLILTGSQPYKELATTGSLVNWVGKAIEKAGIEPDNQVCHRFRQTFASQVLNSGGSLQDVAKLLHHESIDVSVTYTNLDQKRLRDLAQEWPTMEVSLKCSV